MVEGRDEDAFKKTHKDAAPSNNWEVEVAKRISEASASHFIGVCCLHYIYIFFANDTCKFTRSFDILDL